MNDVFEETRAAIKSSCKHAELSSPPHVRAENAWSDEKFSGKRLFLHASSLRQCRKCGAVFWPEQFQSFQAELGEALANLPQFLPYVHEINVRLGQDVLRPGEEEQQPPTEQLSLSVQSPRFCLSDVILPASTSAEIEEALVKVRYHRKIYEEWGFSRVDPAGRGAVLNFYGPSGTGKTRCAEALAGELGVPFLPVSQADMESRFMGQTLKNIRTVFETARGQGSLLFFDEADTVLGKRLSSVTQGVDSEINGARATMLIEMDRFEGVAIFASNFPSNYDSAFRRRISHHIRFDLPDLAARARLWELHLVPEIPLAGDRAQMVSHLALATEGLSGGYILMALRLALPTALREGGETARLSLAHIESALARVRRAHEEVGREVHWWRQPSQADDVRSMFGMQTVEEQHIDDRLQTTRPPEATADQLQTDEG